MKGWLLNIKTDYNNEVFDLLTKSIKLKPNFNKAWIELGECYFKKGELKLALNAFDQVLKQNPNDKKALRNASVMTRSLQCTGEEKKRNILKSIDLAKKAIACDLNDGDSWAVLANAYLTLLFMSKRTDHITLVKNCKSAYQKALIDPKVETKADVLFNYALILQFDEDFEEALNCLLRAHRYDFEWSELELRKNYLTTFFCEICQKLAFASGLKAKNLNSMIENIKHHEDKLLNRYANSEEMFNGNVKKLCQLSEGENDCLFLCKVLSYTSDSHNVFLCSVLNAIDSTGRNVALFIYDIIPQKGPKPGDLVLIIRPFLKNHQIKFENKEYNFQAIKIINPMQEIYVNNKRLSMDCFSIPIVNVILKSD